MKIFRRLFPSRIWQQIYIVLILLVTIPLVTLGFLLIHSGLMAIKTGTLNGQRMVAQRTTGEIRQNVETARRSVDVLASVISSLHLDDWHKETAVVELSLRMPEFINISVCDLTGQEIVKSQLGKPAQDKSGDKVFLETLKGQGSISDIRFDGNGSPFLTIASPVVEMGKMSAVLIADLDLSNVWSLIDSLRIGRTGIAYLVNADGEIIAHPDKKNIFKQETDPDALYVTEVLKGLSGSMETAVDGVDVLIAYSPVPELNWGLIIRQDKDEALAVSGLMERQARWTIAISIAVALLISLFLARFMSRPMNRMLQILELLVRGEAVQPSRIQRKDEIGRMLFLFNRLANQLRQVQEAEKFAILGKAAGSIAHELKNSLVLIKSFIEVLPERHKDKAFIKEFSDTIPRELNSWNLMLRNMMGFSQLSEMKREEVCAETALKDVGKLIKQNCEIKNIQLEMEFDPGLPKIRGDSEQLKKVFINVLLNAIEACPEKGGRISISGHTDTDDREILTIKVRNNGAKIPDEDQKKIFEPFYSTKKGGYGFGLTLANEIVKKHKGGITMITEDIWTAFLIKLPAVIF